MSLAFLFHYLMLNMFRMLTHPSPGACDLFVELFHGLYCSGTMRVGVTLWFGWGGVVSGCRLRPAVSCTGVHETATYTCDDTRCCVMQFRPLKDEHMCSKHVET